MNLLKPLLLIGVSGNGVSKLLTWNFIAGDDSFEEVPGLEESTITNFIATAGALVASIGSKLFYYNGILDSPLKTLDSSIALGAMTNFNSMIHIGTKHGIYSLGKTNLSYNTSLNLEYVTSQGTPVTAIGAICGNAGVLYCGWENSGIFGIDIIDTANKATTGIIDTLVLRDNGKMSISKIKIYFDLLPTGTSIQVQYKKDGDTSWNNITNPDTAATITTTSATLTSDEIPLGVVCDEIQFRIILNSSGNTAPTFKGLYAGVELS